MGRVKLENKNITRKSYLFDLIRYRKIELEISTPYGPMEFTKNSYNIFNMDYEKESRVYSDELMNLDARLLADTLIGGLYEVLEEEHAYKTDGELATAVTRCLSDFRFIDFIAGIIMDNVILSETNRERRLSKMRERGLEVIK